MIGEGAKRESKVVMELDKLAIHNNLDKDLILVDGTLMSGELLYLLLTI